jgi:hypothetical protein
MKISTRNDSVNRLSACNALLTMRREIPKVAQQEARSPEETRSARTVNSEGHGDESRAKIAKLSIDSHENGSRSMDVDRYEHYVITSLPYAVETGSERKRHSVEAAARVRSLITLNSGSSSTEESDSPDEDRNRRSRSCSPLKSETSGDDTDQSAVSSSTYGKRARLQPVRTTEVTHAFRKHSPWMISAPVHYSQRTAAKLPSPMAPAPLLWKPFISFPYVATTLYVPCIPHFCDYDCDSDRFIAVTFNNYERMTFAVLQRALKVIHAPKGLRTKPKVLQYLRSYFVAIRDRSHVISVEK